MKPKAQFANSSRLTDLSGLSRAAIYAKSRTGEMPAPFQVSKQNLLWRLSEIKQWQDGGEWKPDNAAIFDPEKFYSDVEAAKVLDLSPTTFANWRAKRHGPFYYRGGSQVAYRGDDLNDFVLASRVAQTPATDVVFVRIDPVTREPAPRPLEAAEGAPMASPSPDTPKGEKGTLALSPAAADKAMKEGGAWFGPGQKPGGEA